MRVKKQINFDMSYGPLISGVFEIEDKERLFAVVDPTT